MRLLFLMALVLNASGARAQEAEIRAQLSPSRYTTLSSELGARIEKITVKEGDRFQEGQTLVSLDCAVQRAGLEKGRASLAAAMAAHSVNRTLHQMNAGGAFEADMAAAEEQKARAEVDAASAIVGKCTVLAPFPGRVAELRVREQQFVQPGMAMIEILDDSVLEVEFLAPSRWLARLNPGTTFQISVDETGRSYPAVVARLGARVDPVSQSIKVIGEIRGTFPELLAGMSGKVQMTTPVVVAQ
jgi:membrane fusion protein, multidrug efflux system